MFFRSRASAKRIQRPRGRYPQHPCGRWLRFESLEERRLLAAGPTISSICLAPTAATPVLTWNVADDAGITSATMSIDGASLTVDGPYGTSTNANYAGLLGTLLAGSHTYSITATDSAGASTTSSGVFSLAGPVGTGPAISSVVVALSGSTPVLTWNVSDAAGIQSTTIAVDGANQTIYGPYGSDRNANYSTRLGQRAAGNHTYSITATDNNGVVTTASSQFVVAEVSPTISGVVVDLTGATPVITWNATDSTGVLSTAITVDGSYLTVSGPYGTSTNASYAAALGTLSAGNHTLSISLTNTGGASSAYTTTFSTSTIGPAISSICLAPLAATPVITWNVSDPTTFQSTTITVDGIYLTVYGAYGTNINANFAGVLASLAPGKHTYAITAADNNAVATTYSSTFTVGGIGPAVSSVIAAPTAATPVLTWNAADAAGVAAATMTVDGANQTIYGPFGGSTNGNYAGLLGTLSTGSHAYAISVQGADGTTTTYSSSFVVSNVVATISAIVIAPSASTPVITWNVADTLGVQAARVTVDGASLTVYGPYGSSTSANYAGLLGTLSPGTHTYAITATGANGVSVSASGSFSIVSAAAVDQALLHSPGTSVKSDWLMDDNAAAG